MHCSHIFLVLFMACTGLVAGTPAAAEDWKLIDSTMNENIRAMVVTPVFSQKIVHGIPKDWKAGYEKSDRETYTMEFVPENQTVQSWKEMITLQGFRDLAKNPNATPKSLLSSIAVAMRKACGDKAITLSLGDTKVDSYDAHGAIMGCSGPPAEKLSPGVKGRGEVALYLAIRGAQDMYVIQRAIRAEEFTLAGSPINAANAYLFFRELQPIKLCALNAPEAECIERKPR